MHFSDPYAFYARVQPALIVVLPLGLLILAWMPGNTFAIATFFGLLGTVGGSLFAQMGRDQGRKKEPKLWRGWGGRPTTIMLRHRSSSQDRAPEHLRQQLEELTGHPLPTAQEEKAAPADADSRYEEAVGFLREATRDRTKFPLVFAENVNYGFRRNLWGLKPWGLGIAVPVACVSWTLTYFSWECPCMGSYLEAIVNPDSTAVIRTIVSIANAILVAFWLFWVTKRRVRSMADAYALQLLQSTQTLKGE